MILFLHGGDTYRSRQKLKEIREKFQKEVDPNGYNLLVLDGNTIKSEHLAQAISASPFLAPKRMVIVEQLSKLSLSEEEEESLVGVIKRVMDEENILVVWEEELKKKELSAPVFKAVQKTQFNFAFEPWNHQQVAGWVRQRLSEQGIDIAPAALQHLSLSVEDNLWLAALETDKLIHYAQANELKRLDDSHVKNLVAGGAQDNVFALVDAVSANDLKKGLYLLQDQMKAGSHELEILSLLFRQYRLLAQAKDAQKKGMPAAETAKAYQMHPYVAGKMLSQTQRFSEAQLADTYKQLLRADKLMKSSGLPMDILLTKAVAQITAT